MEMRTDQHTTAGGTGQRTSGGNSAISRFCSGLWVHCAPFFEKRQLSTFGGYPVFCCMCNFLTNTLTKHSMTPTTLKITEIFYSLQGEANTVGLPTVFVRLTGCPSRCGYRSEERRVGK